MTPPPDSYTQVRRADRQVTDEAWMRDVLQRAPVGTLATVSDGQPFVNMNLFAYDPAGHCLYLHTARSGRTRLNLERAPRVCFGVYEMGRLLPASEALEFSVEYASVMCFGTIAFVDEPAPAAHGLQLLLDKYFGHLRPERDYRPIKPEELARTSVYRFAIEQWSAKRKAVAPDFPGAFTYGQPPLATDH
jgi:nitroimidazol reductase NimA-like FMN-containing flavoprotein (pyridoxamine 5'-phosphate oxidase superfamily)